MAASSPVTIRLEDGAVSPCYGIQSRAQRVGITVKPASPGQDTMVLLAFGRDPVTVKQASWDAERQALTAIFSNGTQVQLGMRNEQLGWKGSA